MNWLYALAQPFVWHPSRAFLVAVAWAIVAVVLPRVARWPVLLTAGAWSLFALLELEAWRERANIRVDLLVTWPALCVLTIVCLVVAGRRIISARTVRRRGEAA